MPNYIYFQHDKKSLEDRFTIEEGEIRGASIWKHYIKLLLLILSPEGRERIPNIVLQEIREFGGGEEDERRPPEVLILMILLMRLKNVGVPQHHQLCPQLFISHRQNDGLIALRIAELAADCHFYYWVDVEDPGLRILAKNKSIPPHLIPLLTACIIEMGIINSSHVIACMTPSARGSLWMPYEYGRITEVFTLARKASAWVHPSLDRKDFPEYMFLGEIAESEPDITDWLIAEKRKWMHINCPGPSHHPCGGFMFPELPSK